MIIGFVDHASTMNFLPKLAFFYVHENNGVINISSRHIDGILIDEYIGVMLRQRETEWISYHSLLDQMKYQKIHSPS
jgi:hypothetical protein